MLSRMVMFQRFHKVAWFFLALAIPFIASTVQAEEISDLAEALVKLRGEVETLSMKLEQQKNDQSDRLRSLARRKTDLEVQIQKEEFRIKQIGQSLERQRELLAKDKTTGDTLRPTVQAAIKAIREYVEGSLPFQKIERLAALEELQQKLDSGQLSEQRILQRLWAFVEDELRLTRESGLYRQSIKLDDEDKLAEVARIGMIMLFFQTSDGVCGMAKRENSSWSYVAVSDPKPRDQILTLFDSFKKQIRNGYFVLPNALSAKEGAL